MNANRAFEILAAYGADAARWPATERDGCAELIAVTPALQAECAGAAVLDASLAVWARASVRDERDAADAVARACAALPASAPLRRAWLPWVGGALAAASATMLYLAPGRNVALPAPAAHPVAAIVQSQADSELFRATFTPTPDEEDVL